MTGIIDFRLRHMLRLVLAALLSIAALIGPATTPALAASGDRTLYLYYTHTKETGSFTFRRNGQYDQKVLAQLNVFLRDWRRNEPAKMDPALFDLIWQVYQDVGATQPIHVVSAYRSPATNEMLRSKSSGVAENSQHTKGRAMDFFIPGVPLATLRAAAMRRQVGGVGYYPTSGSPFVHLDTGSVRAWPLMPRTQLAKLFPDGRTLHMPAEGKPLSEEGRRYALAQWQQCHAVPCSDNSTTRLASNGQSGSKGNLMDMLFGRKDKAPQPNQAQPVAQPPVQVAAATSQGPTQRQVQSVAMAPVPAPRPDELNPAPVQTAAIAAAPVDIPFSTTGSAPLEADEAGGPAPVPAIKSTRLAAATGNADAGGQSAIMAIAALDQVPVPASRPDDLVAAYAPSFPHDPQAERDLQAIIASQTQVPAGLSPAARTASLAPLGAAGPAGKSNTVASLMDGTWKAVTQTGDQSALAAALAAKTGGRPDIALPVRPAELYSPDLDHVAETMVAPVAISGALYADIGEAGEGDFDPKTQLGAYATQVTFTLAPDAVRPDRFTRVNPALQRL